jgi:hypothetical protein
VSIKINKPITWNNQQKAAKAEKKGIKIWPQFV